MYGRIQLIQRYTSTDKGEVYLGIVGPVRTRKIYLYQEIYGGDGAAESGRERQSDCHG